MSTTIGSLSTSTTSNIRGYGGLASGLDRDSLIEGMTYGTTSKITAQQQKKQQLEWKQTAVRSITDMMVKFANKYTSSWGSSTNLFSSVLWGRSNITTTGANSKFVSVSGTASSSNSIQIMGVKQLAKQAQYSSQAGVSTKALETGSIDTSDTTVENLVGKKISVQYGNTSASIILSSTIENEDGEIEKLSYNSAEEIAKSINKLLAKEELGSGKTFADVIKVSAEGMDADGKGGKITFTNTDNDGNKCQITGGNALSYLGFKEPESSDDEAAIKITKDGVTGDNQVNDLERQVSFAEKIAGKELTFNYNGKAVSIKVPSQAELNKADESGNVNVLENLRSSLQTELNKAFGRDRIEVKLTGDNNDKLSFKTMDPTTGSEDPTSTLTLTTGSADLVGKNGALNVAYGESNRLNLNEVLAESGLSGINLDAKGTTIKINGVDIEVTNKDTVYTLMDKINDSDAGVKVSYQQAADKFVFTATDEGASGRIDFSGNTGDSADLLDAIFGAGTSTADVAKGQDAIVTVKYAGSDEAVTLKRGSNSFELDGLTISAKGEFGYLKDADGNVTDELDPTAEAVGINAQVNTDSIVDAVKTMVEEYNAIIELVNKELTTKPDRDYTPLTSEQKKELSEDEIKLYEEKAKAGLLFGDSDLRTLSTDLRFIISAGYSQALENAGISTSSSYSDGGKLVFDESKFRAALESDPEAVEKLFTDKGSVDERGNTNYGLATTLQNVMDKYAKTMGSWETKGILVRKAGTESSALSLTENFMYKEIAEIDKIITKLQARLESERDRYIKQFTSLETLISQMNSQSNYLSQIGGSY